MLDTTSRAAGGVPARTAPPDAPGQEPPSAWHLAERVAVIGIFVILATGALIYGRPIALPIVSAFIIGVLIGALVDALARRGVPPPMASVAIVATLAVVLYAIAIVLSGPLSAWIARAPELGQLLKQHFAVLKEPVAGLKEVERSLSSLLGPEAALPVSTGSSPLASALSLATPAFTQFLIFVGTLLFFLATRVSLKRKLVTTFESREARLTALKVLADIERGLGHYLGVVTMTSASLGVVIAGAMALIGLPNAGLWGFLAFVMNFIPFIGPTIMVLVLFAVGLMTFPSLAGALLPPFAYLVLHGCESQFITPGVLGRRLTLNPLLVFLSLSFWAWIWGPVGAFLAVPILVAGVVILDHLRGARDDVVKLPG